MKKVNVPCIVAIISIIIILYISIRFNYWYHQNNLKFVSESIKEQITDWLHIDKEYSNSLELINANRVSSGLSSHDKYCELIFKISKEEYEKNSLDYNLDFDSPEMTLKGKKEYDDNNFICIIRYEIILHNDEYYTLSYIISSANIFIRIANIIIFLLISLILIFIGYLNTIKIKNGEDKAKCKKNMIITSILVSIIAFSIIMYILFNKKDNLSEYLDNLSNLKNQSSSTTDATQIATENIDMEMRQKEIDEKMKSIMYGVLNCVGEVETEYNEEEVSAIINKMKIKNGIYISEKGRDKVLNLINNVTNSEYKVDNDGYLISNENTNNEISQKINSIISGDKCIIIDYNIYYYCILGNDICTFNIEETQYLEKFENENMIIMVLNPKKYEEEYESEKDLINQIVNNVL